MPASNVFRSGVRLKKKKPNSRTNGNSAFRVVSPGKETGARGDMLSQTAFDYLSANQLTVGT